MKLDKRITQPEDVHCYTSNTLGRAKRVLDFLILAGVCAFVASETATFFPGFEGEWRLIYPVYFLFDIEGNTWHYTAAHLYQAACITLNFQILISDSFPVMALTREWKSAFSNCSVVLTTTRICLGNVFIHI